MRVRIALAVLLCHFGYLRPCEADEPEEVATFWVDPKAPAGGDGSEAHPYRTLSRALKRDGRKRIRLAPGVYRGAFELAGGTELWGPAVELDPGDSESGGAGQKPNGTAVLVGKPLRTTLMVDGPSHVRGLRIRGGGPALWLRTGGLELRDVRIEGTGGKGLLLDPESAAVLERVAFRGTFQRAIELTGATLEGKNLRLEGDTGLHAVRSRVDLQKLQVMKGSGVGLFCGGSVFKLREVTVRGHEYGLLSRGHCKLDVQGLWADHPDRAGLALVESEGYLSDLKVTESGSYGGIQLLSSDLRLERFELDGGEAYGVSIRGGTIKLRAGTIKNIRDRDGGAGDGVHVRVAKVELRAVSLIGIAGAGLLAAEEAEVEGREMTFRDIATSALWAETGAQIRIDAGKFERLKEQWVTIPSKGQVKLVGAEVHGLSKQPFVMDCQRGARLELSRLSGDPVGALPRCAH